MAGTINLADLYGIPSSARPAPDRLSAAGPNQGAVVQSQAPSMADSGPAFSWLGLLLGLVALRVFIEMGGRVETP